jgi:hypothetical protein
MPLEMTEGNYSNVGHRGPVYKGLGAVNPCDNHHHRHRQLPLSLRIRIIYKFLSLLNQLRLSLSKDLPGYMTNVSSVHFKNILTQSINVDIKFRYPLLEVFIKLRKAIISFVTSVCPSIRPHEITRLTLDGFL